MNRLRAALTALALAVTVLLTGCGQEVPTTAAVVNGVVIHARTVDSVAQGLAAVSAKPREAHTDAINTLIQGELARQIAKQKGIALTPPDMDALIQKYPTLATFLASDDGRRFAADSISWSQVTATLSTEDLAAALNAQDVLLNPRYGTWGTSVGSGSLSQAAPGK
ncbi:MAG: hypothetical protein ACOH16_02465 [Propionibacteriaceae bacterium]